MLKNELDEYKKFYQNFGIQLKAGVYNNYGMDKDKLKDLLMFHSSKNNDLITLKEYAQNTLENQDKIYYVSGESIAKIDNIPLVEQVKEKGYDILYLTDYIDEFVLKTLDSYDDKKFINIASYNLDLEDENTKKELEKINNDNKEMLEFIKNELNISDVKLTNKLKNHPVCLTSKGTISLEMEKVLNALPNTEKVQAEIILEINQNHKIVDKLKSLFDSDKEELKKYIKILYSQARLIEGLSIDNPTELSNLICEIISN
jgi:molecular chaperone HtpG